MKIKNAIFIGILIGFFSPLILIFIFYIFRFANSINITSFVQQIISMNVHLKIIALSVYLSNFILFYIFIKAEYLYVARGILIVTILYTLFIVIQKFL